MPSNSSPRKVPKSPPRRKGSLKTSKTSNVKPPNKRQAQELAKQAGIATSFMNYYSYLEKDNGFRWPGSYYRLNRIIQAHKNHKFDDDDEAKGVEGWDAKINSQMGALQFEKKLVMKFMLKYLSELVLGE